jgi:uncharacterized OB-fold protein
LIGNSCKDCGEVFFPAHGGCTRCGGVTLNDIEIGSTGVLWYWTIQGFMPKYPFNGTVGESGFTAYGVGYIEMPSGIKIESRLKESDPAVLRIGMPMNLALDPYRYGEDGRAFSTYMFVSAEGETQ